MPLVLEGNSAEAWLLADLNQQEMTALMVPYPGGEMLGSQRGKDGVGNTRLNTNVEEVLKPL